MNRRIAVTGIGLVTPLGIGKAAFAERLFEGDSAVAEITAFDTSRFPSHLGAEVRDFNARDFISLKTLRRMDRLSRMATASARLALEDAGIVVGAANRDRIGILLGTAFGATDIKSHCARILCTDGPGMVNPILVPNTVMNAPAGHASIELGIRGVNTTVNHHAASGETAIACAAMDIRRGAADVVLAGGADILSEFFFEALIRFRAVSPVDGREEGARPFDRRRNGPVIGEGAGVICLEDMDRARERGAIPYCEIAGWGMSASPARPTDWPDDPRGVILAMERAVRSSGLAPKDIDVVQAAANGGRNPDHIEAEACSRFFALPARPLVTSVKGAAGESFSSGGIRAAALALSIQERKAPPTLGLADPIGRLNVVTGASARADLRCGLLNGISYGGTNISIVVKA
jgi:3-oxoacyl-[acyl-carrier-protein] synthase II